MSEPAKRRRGPLLWLAERSWRFWIVAGLLPPMLYVLSIGPVNSCGALSFEAFVVVYWPIMKIAEASPVILHVLSWYVHLWEP